jgi:radical SAM superfamily enzyme YgiQ (UPF0313 family)
MAKILLINPPIGKAAFPIGIATVHAYLYNKGHETEIIDLNKQAKNKHEIIKQVKKESYDIVGFYGMSTFYKFIKEITLSIKESTSVGKIICGGPIASSSPELLLNETGVDIIVDGEADLIISELVNVIENKDDLRNVNNLIFLDGTEIIYTKKAPLIKDMDSIPLPIYDEWDMKYYVSKGSVQEIVSNSHLSCSDVYKKIGVGEEIKRATMWTSRGCYGRCTFCMLSGRRVHYRHFSVNYIIKHLKLLISEHGVNVFDFRDALTLSSQKFVKELCDKIVRKKLKILFICTSRGDLNLNNDLAKMLKEAGCFQIGIGFESANDDVLRLLKKDIKVESYGNMVKVLQLNKIDVSGHFILNVPGETKKALRDNVKFVKKYKLRNIAVHYLEPMPKTPIFNWAIENEFIKSEKDYLIKDISSTKKGQADFDRYYNMFNFNNVPGRIYKEYRIIMNRLKIINILYYKRQIIKYYLKRFLEMYVKFPLKLCGIVDIIKR